MIKSKSTPLIWLYFKVKGKGKSIINAVSLITSKFWVAERAALFKIAEYKRGRTFPSAASEVITEMIRLFWKMAVEKGSCHVTLKRERRWPKKEFRFKPLSVLLLLLLARKLSGVVWLVINRYFYYAWITCIGVTNYNNSCWKCIAYTRKL